MTRACAGALPPGERASFTLPLGACDTHVHLLGPYSRFPLAENRSYTAPEATADDLIALQESLGLQRAVIVNATAYGTDSAVMLAALRAYPHRLRGVAVLEPDTTDAELDRLHAAGVRGIRINLYRRNGNIVYRGGTGLESLRALGYRIAERGWHAQIWISVDDLAEVLPQLEASPVAIVFDHMGRVATDRSISDPGFALLCELLKRGKYWCKLCGPDRISLAGRPYRDADPFARALIAANVDRLVWGSDWPHVAYWEGGVPADAVLLDLLARWTSDPLARRKILADNPARLYQF